MTTYAYVIGILASVLLLSVPLAAHHSFSAEFDIDKPVTVRGTLTAMEWVNPHGWIHVDVKGPDGKIVNWAIETGSPTSLLRRGLRKTDFQLGTEVVITGFRARSGRPIANGQSVTLADGREFFAGSQGNGAPEEGAR